MTLGFAPSYSCVRFRLFLGDANKKKVNVPYYRKHAVSSPWTQMPGTEYIHPRPQRGYLETLLLNITVWSLEEKYRDLFSQNHNGQKRSSSATQHCQIHHNHVLKCHIYVSFKYLQGWWLYHFPGQPAPMLDSTFHEEILSNIQSKPPLEQPEDVTSWLTPTSFQALVESH